MNLKKNAHIHLMGICGTAMASLAGLLKSLGYKITGSDQNVYPPMSTQLQDLGISIQEGYKKENLEPRPDLVIVGNVISKKIPKHRPFLKLIFLTPVYQKLWVSMPLAIVTPSSLRERTEKRQ